MCAYNKIFENRCQLVNFETYMEANNNIVFLKEWGKCYQKKVIQIGGVKLSTQISQVNLSGLEHQF